MENINIDIDQAQVQNSQYQEPNVPDIEEVVKQPSHEMPVQQTVQTEHSDEDVIGEIKSAFFGGFVKILGFLSQGAGSQDIIYIKEGKLNLVKNAGFIYCDLSVMFNNNNIEIIDPAKSIKLLNLIKGGDSVVFIRDDSNSRYLVSNIHDGVVNTTITLPQPDRSVVQDISAPDLGELVFNQTVDIDIVDNIQAAAKTLESQFLKIELQDSDNKIISIGTNDDIFKQQINSKDAGAKTTTYKVFNPFPINKPDEVFVEIHKNGDNLWIKTINMIGMATIEYSEAIESIGEFDTFML